MKKEKTETTISPIDYRIDNLDRQIIALLVEDANRPYTDIAQALIVSHGTIHVRMKKLREMGVVTGAHLAVDVRKLGWDISAFVGVILERAIDSLQTVEIMRGIPEIAEVYYVTGEYSLLVKVICHNSAHLLEVLKDKIQTIQGVGRTETFILLQEGIRRSVQIADVG
jgi:Lrp/AsnC family transcriptional regulator, regulator for asnA, asnC and gidA